MTAVLLLAAGVALTHTPNVSRGVLAIYWLLAIVFVGATRFLARTYFLRTERGHDDRKRVVIYAAGQAGTQLVYALRAGREYLPVAFVDDSPAKQKTEVAGLRVHAPHKLASLIASKRVDEVLLAIPSASRARRAEIIEAMDGLHCKLQLVPGIADVVSGNVTVDVIREVEIEDLLGRESVAPDDTLLGRCITGKTVLVSGAGGSIGSELCRQIVRLQPSRLVLLERSEFALYSIEQELASLCARRNLSVELMPVLGSVTHQRRNELVMRNSGVQTVYHAAAYKHVPLMEDHNAGHQKSGLRKALDIFKPIDGIGQLFLSSEDVVRHRLVKEIIKSYDLADEVDEAGKLRIREAKEKAREAGRDENIPSEQQSQS